MKESASISLNYHRYRVNKYFYTLFKRLFDIVLSITGLCLGLPLMVIVGFCIKLESKGPVFYKQVRVGKDGKHFTIYKFRSMVVNAEIQGICWAEQNDPRATRVGRFIRKTKIDELPQLFNILKGEMSFVGPRPERPYFVEAFSSSKPEFLKRLHVKPGLTGWAQINGGYALSPEEKLGFDLYYIENKSLLFDLLIVCKTFKFIVQGYGCW